MVISAVERRLARANVQPAACKGLSVWRLEYGANPAGTLITYYRSTEGNQGG